jgi:hypothetical protein
MDSRRKYFWLRSSGVQWMVILAWMLLPSVRAQTDASTSQFRQQFAYPPDDCRIMMRWWWFGPAVTRAELKHELTQMKEDGIGGVEIANLYPLALDDPGTGFHNQSYLSDEHIDMIRYAADEARRLGMRVDITLGSGWPFGGPHIPITEAAGLLRVEMMKVPSQATSIGVPNLSTGEKLLAVFMVEGAGEHLALRSARQVSGPSEEELRMGRLGLPEGFTDDHTVVFFISSRTGMVVKRPSVGASGFVMDHYDKKATQIHLEAVGNRLLQAFGSHPPYSVFSDSLEDYGSNWTGDLVDEFRRRRGYDLTPYLPALIGDIGPQTAAVRHDWGKTLTELADENFLIPMQLWARQNHTLLRSQTYGYPPVTLSSNQFVDLPEGEGKADLMMWRRFSDTRWAASAGHLFGKNIISSETWTWLHSPAFRATPLDMKAEADLHFIQGINQLVGHGWPYSPESAGEPGWTMYAAGALNNHNPWSFVFPDLTKYLQRVSFALREGSPANDVALLLPTDDAWASFRSGVGSSSSVTTELGFNTAGTTFSIDEAMDGLLGEDVIASVLDAEFNLDFIDADAIDKFGIPYRALILPGVDRIPLATYKKIEDYARRGGVVISSGRPPATAPGLVDADKEGQQIRQISNELFDSKGALGHWLQDHEKLGGLLSQLIEPGLRFSEPATELGFIHRKLIDGDLFFIANTSNHPHHVQASFRSEYRFAESWDAMTGESAQAGSPSRVDLNLQPYESRLYLLSDASHQQPRSARNSRTKPVEIDLSSDWTLTFKGMNKNATYAGLHSWADEESSKYYSGLVVYKRVFELAAAQVQQAEPLYLDFGQGTIVDLPSPLGEHSMRAYLESPIREAAEVYVNGNLAGSVWHPPYSVRIDTMLKAGKNELTIVVGNTAINALSGRDLPDYRLLKDRFGDLFSRQDMEHLSPLPSGILGNVRIVSSDRR